jgi:hypothetical protein
LRKFCRFPINHPALKLFPWLPAPIEIPQSPNAR